jgi:HAMP domain-containing protein
MRALEKSGPLVLGLGILLIFGLLLPESDRVGVTYLAAVLLGLLAGLEGFRFVKERPFPTRLTVAAGGVIGFTLLIHLTDGWFEGSGPMAQAMRHAALFVLSAFFFGFFLVVLPVLRKTYRGWRRILFYTVCILCLLPVLFAGVADTFYVFAIVYLLFGIRWREVRSISSGPLALLVFVAAIVGLGPFFGESVGATTFISPMLTPEVDFLARRLAIGLFEFLRIGLRLFCIFFAAFGVYHWAAVLLFGPGRVRSKLLGVYFLTALIPLSLFTVLVLFGLYLMIASYRSTLTKNLFSSQQVRFHRWVASMSSRPAFWEDLRPVEKGVRRLPLPQLDLYPTALFDVLQEVESESDSIRVYTVVGGSDTIRIPAELRGGGTTMGVCNREFCLYALLPTKGFMLRAWLPITRDFLLSLKEVAGTDITIYPRGTETIGTRLRFGGSDKRGVWFSFADADSVAEFARISTREWRRKLNWLDEELVVGVNHVRGVHWQTGEIVTYTYVLWLTPLRLWQTIFNPQEPINLGMRAAFYILGIIFLGAMVAISWVGWRVAGGINRSARSLEKGVQELRLGHLDYTMPVAGGAEFRQVAESFNLLTADIRRMLRDLTDK